jgi:hypothetical protein
MTKELMLKTFNYGVIWRFMHTKQEADGVVEAVES